MTSKSVLVVVSQSQAFDLVSPSCSIIHFVIRVCKKQAVSLTSLMFQIFGDISPDIYLTSTKYLLDRA